VVPRLRNDHNVGMDNDSAAHAQRALASVADVARLLPALSPTDLDQVADAVEALTDAIGLQRDWPGGEPASEEQPSDVTSAD